MDKDEYKEEKNPNKYCKLNDDNIEEIVKEDLNNGNSSENEDDDYYQNFKEPNFEEFFPIK